jgi:hydrogenase expression/formation protein HypC
MCLAIPGKVMSIDGKTAVVDFGGMRREVRLDLLAGVHKSDYVIVHVGYAIQTLDEKEAKKILESWKEIAESGGLA